MPKPFNKSDFKAAVRDPNSGKVFTGVEHYDALKAAKAEGFHSLGNENICRYSQRGTGCGGGEEHPAFKSIAERIARLLSRFEPSVDLTKIRTTV